MSDWWQQAACRGRDQRLWFPRQGDMVSPMVARAVCRACPVRSECLAEALTDPETVGVWGGTTELQRRRMRAAQRAVS